ncbi:MAG: hypothetical protein RL421_103 [Actinomycetota bacterium]
MTVRKTVLPSGLRIVTEEISGVRSAAYGIWVNVGSRDESPKVAGASHFLEHLLFKGTKTRSALDRRDECLHFQGVHLFLCTRD